MKKTLIGLGLAALMSTSAMAQEIGATISRFDDNWLTVMRNGMTEHAASLDGVNLQMEDATDDLSKQIDQVKNFVAAGVDAIIVNIVDTSAGAAVTEAAGNVPLVFVNREPDNVDSLPPTQAFVASNEIESGTLSAFQICNNLRADGKAGGARGYLIGPENRGLNCMFTFMNTARIGTALQGLSHAELSFQGALTYARERLAMRSLTGPKNPGP